MNATPDTGLALYLHAPHASERTTPLALSLTIHALGIAGIALLHFEAAPEAAHWRPHTILMAPPPAAMTLPRPRTKRAITPPHEEAQIRLPGNARPFHAPEKPAETRVQPSPAAVGVPLPAIAMLATPPATSPMATSFTTSDPHLPVLPAPPLKTDNLSAAGAASAAAVNGKVEPSGFGTAAARVPSASGARSSVGAFGSAGVSTRASSDAAVVRSAAFGNVNVAAQHAQAETPKTFANTPVEIVEKPRPKYTDEARRLGIEGEVLVEASFPAVGPARVLRVIRGLGHGLDQNAEAATQAIRFRPATRAGQPVDSTAVVHIVFEIAF